MLGDDWLKLNQDELYVEFDRWIREISEDDYWSKGNPSGQRIHWKSIIEASEDDSKKSQFAEVGCYLFGWGSGHNNVIPRYVGQTGITLKKRMTNRYVPGKRSKPDNAKNTQFCIAVLFECFIKKGRIEQINESFPNPNVRTRHAIDFAKHGTAEMWLGLIPTACEDQVKEIEQTKALVVKETREKVPLDSDFRKAIIDSAKKEAAKKLELNLIRVITSWNQDHGLSRILNKQNAW